MKIGRTVTYLPKVIEHFEAYSPYESGRGDAIVEPLSPDMEALSSNRSVTSPRPRTPQQEIVDLLAVALLRLRAAGPPATNPLPTPAVNEVEKDDLARRRVGMRGSWCLVATTRNYSHASFFSHQPSPVIWVSTRMNRRLSYALPMTTE